MKKILLILMHFLCLVTTSFALNLNTKINLSHPAYTSNKNHAFSIEPIHPFNIHTKMFPTSLYTNQVYKPVPYFLMKYDDKKKIKINWTLPTMPSNIVRKHNAGVGLTVVGTLFTSIGTTLLFVSSNKSNTTTTGSSVRVTGAPAFGVILDIAGIPMLIAGLVKIKKSNNLARQYLSTKSINS